MKKHQVRSEDPVEYTIIRSNFSDDQILEEATRILDSRIRSMDNLTNPADSEAYLRLKLHGRVAEAFCVLWLDNRHRVLAFDELFQGTIDGASVHPREVVRAALKWNAAAAIFSHNHPSGVSEPSMADRKITQELINALNLIGVRVLDHLVVGERVSSMAAMGLM